MPNKYKRVIASRLIITFIAIIFQIFWIYEFIILAVSGIWINIILRILAFLFVLYVASQKSDSSYRILWLIIILSLPIFGTIMYICWGDGRTSKPLDNKLKNAKKDIGIELHQNKEIIDDIKKMDNHVAQNFAYIRNKTGFPVYRNESLEYYKCGEELYTSILEEFQA